MIVKNEERNLRACLEHARPLVDDAVVVDTGSDDRTRYIAHEMGARVYQVPWADDFAAARNAALDLVNHKYALVVDADERFARCDHEAWLCGAKDAMRRGHAVEFVKRNHTENSLAVGWVANRGEYPDDERGPGWFPTPSVSLFPSSTRYVNRIHENPVITVPTVQSAIPLHHYGKLDSERQASKAWYYGLGLRKLKEQGDGFEMRKELGAQAMQNGLTLEALEHWQKAAEFAPKSHIPWLNITTLLVTLKRFEEAEQAAKEAARRAAPDDLPTLYNLGLAQFLCGKPRPAQVCLTKAARKGYAGAIVVLGLLQVAAFGRTDDILRHLGQQFQFGAAGILEFCGQLRDAGQHAYAAAIWALARRWEVAGE